MNVKKPQKACNAELHLIKFPCLVFPKIDGVRGLKITPQFTGRTLKTFRNSNLTDKFSHPLLSGLDGELCFGDITSQSLCRDTTSYCNSYSHNASSNLPDWYIFDFITSETASLPYLNRWELAQKYVAHLRDTYSELRFLQTVPDARICHTIEEVEAAHSEFITAGFEGTVGRSIFQPHKNGRATMLENAYWRIKDFASEEGEIVSFEEAQTNYNIATVNALGLTERSSHKENKAGNGMVGNIFIKRFSDGQYYTIGPGKLTHKERIEYFNEPQRFIGKVCTFTHFPYGAKDKLRFGLFSNFRATEDL